MNSSVAILASTPRYQALAVRLRDSIATGILKPGDRMPSETELAAAHGYSRGTVVRALELLVTEGLVTRRQGAGSFVAHRSLHRRAGQLTSFSDSVRADGHSTDQRLLDFEPADETLARGVGVDPPAMLLSRLRLVDGSACALHRSVLPRGICKRLGMLEDGEISKLELNRPDFSLYACLTEHGLTVHEAYERVAARLATPAEAKLLNVDLPAAVITVIRRSLSADGTLLEAVEAIYRADFYTYDAHLLRGLAPVSGVNAAPAGLRLAASAGSFPELDC